MEFLSFLYLPFGFIFRIFYDLVSNYGLALFLFTLLFRLILLPSSISQQKGTAKQMRLQPKIKKLQEKYKGAIRSSSMKKCRPFIRARAIIP